MLKDGWLHQKHLDKLAPTIVAFLYIIFPLRRKGSPVEVRCGPATVMATKAAVKSHCRLKRFNGSNVQQFKDLLFFEP